MKMKSCYIDAGDRGDRRLKILSRNLSSVESIWSLLVRNEPDQMKIVRLLLDRGADVEERQKMAQHHSILNVGVHFVIIVRRYPWLELNQPCPDKGRRSDYEYLP